MWMFFQTVLPQYSTVFSKFLGGMHSDKTAKLISQAMDSWRCSPVEEGCYVYSANHALGTNSFCAAVFQVKDAWIILLITHISQWVWLQVFHLEDSWTERVLCNLTCWVNVPSWPFFNMATAFRIPPFSHFISRLELPAHRIGINRRANHALVPVC